MSDPWAIKWIKENSAGQEWAKRMGFSDPVVFFPERECKSTDPRPTVMFVGLVDGMSITRSPLDLYVIVTAPANFRQFILMWGKDDNPTQWDIMLDSDTQYTEPTKLYSLDLYQVNYPRITLRIAVQSTRETWINYDVHLNILVPTLEPTATSLPTETPWPTETPTLIPTDTPIPMDTPVPTLTDMPVPTDTPVPMDTETPTPFMP